jgi:hypothetical protein
LSLVLVLVLVLVLFLLDVIKESQLLCFFAWDERAKSTDWISRPFPDLTVMHWVGPSPGRWCVKILDFPAATTRSTEGISTKLRKKSMLKSVIAPLMPTMVT